MKIIDFWLTRLGDSLDRLLDHLTTYRLILYLLIIYLIAATGLGFSHEVPFSASQILLSALVLVAAARLSNMFLGWVFKVPRNQESDLISALILALILSPASSSKDYLILAVAATVAMLSKYLLSYRGHHIFNPAAMGVFVSGLVFHTYSSWWVGTKFMVPFIAIGGLLIVKKMKRVQMVLVFCAVYMSYLTAYAPAEHLAGTLWQGVLISPLLFLASVMLIEPLTSPTTLNQSLVYAFVTGFLFSSRQLHWSPEEALLAGNVLTLLMSPNRSLILKFVGSKKEADEIFSFIFQRPKKLAFAAGQYMEWTLPNVGLDNRGNRRYLTIASSPTEKSVVFSVRIPEPKSAFKTALTVLRPGQQVLAAQLAGDFVLPEDPNLKLVFVAGGIGITPFRSMAQYLIDKQLKRDIKLFYFTNSHSDFAFSDLLTNARQTGLETKYVVGRANKNFLTSALPDYQDRTFYISGPQGFVANFSQILLGLGVDHDQIITDFFPGYN